MKIAMRRCGADGAGSACDAANGLWPGADAEEAVFLKCRPILVDGSLRELTRHGTPDFPLSMDRQVVADFENYARYVITEFNAA